MIKLSILLPVYNQPQELERLLLSLIPQLTSEIEVIIKDDSSNNESENIIKEFAKKYDIRYFRGQKEGIDKALLFLFEKAKGKFIWWIGDDDISKNAISKILEVLNKDVSFIWINYKIGEILHINHKEGFIGRDELLVKAGTGLGFCSSAIFRKDAVDLKEATKYIGTEWVSLFSFLSAMTKQIGISHL